MNNLLARVSILIAACLSMLAMAQDKEPAGGPAPMDPMQIEYEAAVAEAREKSTTGPADVALIDQATLKLPSGYIYFPAKQASRLLRAKDEPDNAERTVNYNTYALGREGFISLNLVTGASAIEAEKRYAKELLAAVNFNSGKSYAEFNSSTDKVAEYGLAALVGGVVAKKLGLFAMLAVFLAKFAKVIGVGALFGGAGLWKYFKNRKASSGADSAT